MQKNRLTVVFSAVTLVLVLMGTGCNNQPGSGQQTATINTQQEEINQLKTELTDIKDKNKNETPPTVVEPKDISAPSVNKNTSQSLAEKQVCNEYLDASITKAKATEWQYNPNAKPGNGSMGTLNYEVFYSPKINSCLFSYEIFLFNDEGKLFGISYRLQDALSGKNIESDDDFYADRSTAENVKKSDDIKSYWNSVLLPSYH